MVANGLGRQKRSQERSHHADDARAPTAMTRAAACWAAASAPGFTRSAGPRGPSGVRATVAPSRRCRTRPSSPTSPPRCDPVGGTGRSEPFTHQRESLTLAPRRAALAVEQRQYGGGQCLRRRGPLEEFGCHLAPRDQVDQSDVRDAQQPDRDGERYGVQAIRDDHRQVDERGFERGRARLAEPGVRRGEYGERIAHVDADGAGPIVPSPRRARYHHLRRRVRRQYRRGRVPEDGPQPNDLLWAAAGKQAEHGTTGIEPEPPPRLRAGRRRRAISQGVANEGCRDAALLEPSAWKAASQRRHDRGGVCVPRRLARRNVDARPPHGAHGRVVARGEAWTASATRKARASAWAPAVPDTSTSSSPHTARMKLSSSSFKGSASGASSRTCSTICSRRVAPRLCQPALRRKKSPVPCARSREKYPVGWKTRSLRVRSRETRLAVTFAIAPLANSM